MARKNIDDMIMTLNAMRSMTKEEQRKDVCYGIFLTGFLIFIPMIVCPTVHLTCGLPQACAALVGSWGIALGTGLSNRRKICREFMRIKNAEQYVRLRIDIEHLALDAPVIALPQSTDSSFLYNWLVRRNAVCEGDMLDAYVWTDWLIIPLEELKLDEENTPQLLAEAYHLSLIRK